MFNPNNELHRERFQKLVQASEKTLRPERDRYAALVRSYIGWRRGDEATEEGAGTPDKIVNNTFEAISAIVSFLSLGQPRFKFRPRNGQNGHFARKIQLHVNNLADEIRLGDTLQSVVLNSCFKLGVAKKYMRDSIPVMVEDDVYSDPGRPFIGAISFNDYGCDMAVLRPGQMTCEWDDYWASWDRLHDSSIADQRVVETLAPSGDRDYRRLDDQQASRASSASGHPDGTTRLEPEIRCKSVYFPRGTVSNGGGIIVDWPIRCDTKPLRIKEYEGEDYCGPYPKLRFDDAPDVIMPVSLAENLQRLDNLGNSLWLKMAMQANQQRDVPVFEIGRGEDDAKALSKANHGQWTGVHSLDSTKVVSIGGVSPNVAQFQLAVQDRSDRTAGNIKSIAGLGSMAPTATEAQLMAGQVNTRLSKMQSRVFQFAAECGDGLAQLLWNDRATFREGWDEIPGHPAIKYPAHWYPNERVGSYKDYMLKVVPYSLEYKSPKQELNDMFTMLERLAPWIAAFEASGRPPQPAEILEDISDLADMPGISRWFGAGEQQSGPREMRQSPVTTRQTIRSNVSGGGPSAMETLAGMRQEAAE